jgi:NAD(P)-dependent dehydrogenase (short-subunit alcohol dehydrogenase family)
MPGLLTGQVAVVTGAGRGIGRAYARALAAEGARVVVNDWGGDKYGAGRGPGPADAVVAEIAAAGGEALANFEDVGRYDAAGRIFGAALDRYGRLDILLTNAGIERRGFIYDITEDDWDAVHNVHVKGTFNCVHQAVPVMRRQGGGVILTVISGAAFIGGPRLGPYAAAKAAIYGLSLVLANELRPFGISVNCLSPNATRTDLAAEWLADYRAAGLFTDAQAEAIWSAAQEPENMAPLAVYLCTDAGRALTGHAFEVNANQICRFNPVTRSEPLTARGAAWTVEEIAERLPQELIGS